MAIVLVEREMSLMCGVSGKVAHDHANMPVELVEGSQGKESCMLLRWDLNPIVLCFFSKFFRAANSAVEQWENDEKGKQGTMLSLAGNVLWAQSPYISGNESEEEMLAMLGALAGTIGDKVGEGNEPSRGAQITELLAQQERNLLLGIDEVLDGLLDEMRAEGLKDPSPGETDQWIWEHLFPSYPYGLSEPQLKAAFRARIDEMQE